MFQFGLWMIEYLFRMVEIWVADLVTCSSVLNRRALIHQVHFGYFEKFHFRVFLDWFAGDARKVLKNYSGVLK